ncbi:DUF4145 domain-containing protein [Mucilaginibacter gotjawali]|uniref:Uncharacterized protein n=2 Tax=Mucilaginibacter gotjawali TaxID=1550579 RepID=A0A839SHZ0_9SPHI|nr:DUF4145 domain-containing protein [Mucilaginibacter gotjawali]MBB3057466.1 hypothetical protein [Mucilaginibacter gotjawali]BAU55415.1 hypothetical protein MgSA37_03599 [Mucilaginibacter gotjawali]
MALHDTLQLQRCPHCSIDKPHLMAVSAQFGTIDDTKTNRRDWRVYVCQRCGGPVLAGGMPGYGICEIYPNSQTVNDILPLRVREYLKQAIDSTFAPSGATILCASAVDAMLKEKGYKEGSLYKRIETAVKDSIITPDMAKWAHQVRIGANDERHSDEDAALPTIDDAKQAIEFTKTLAELLFVLPSKVSKGLDASSVAKA